MCMKLLNDSLLELITHLEAVQSHALEHEQRKNLLLSLHQLKLTARKEQVDSVTYELQALEYSLGFGQEEKEIQVSEIQEHIQRLKQLAGLDDSSEVESQTQELPEPETITTMSEASSEPVEIEVDEQPELKPSAPLHLTLCNVKSRDEAQAIARGLVENRLAACVNFIANIGAIYRWQDNIEDASECQLQIKSVPSRDEDIKNYIIAHHSYDVPEIITMPVHQVNDEYVQWVIQETTP